MERVIPVDRNETLLGARVLVLFDQAVDAGLVNFAATLKDAKRSTGLSPVQEWQNDVVVRPIPEVVHDNECIPTCSQD